MVKMWDRNISHFYYPVPPRMWENIKTFLPFYRLIWSEDIDKKICGPCPLAEYVHPMVREGNRHSYRKLCTISVIRNGLLTLKCLKTKVGVVTTMMIMNGQKQS